MFWVLFPGFEGVERIKLRQRSDLLVLGRKHLDGNKTRHVGDNGMHFLVQRTEFIEIRLGFQICTKHSNDHCAPPHPL
jgi:hypothetical protein